MFLKEFRNQELLVRIYQDRALMGKASALAVSSAILALLERQEEVNIIFGAAPSQNELLQGLVDNRAIPWERVNAFMMDEYLGLPSSAPQRFGNFLYHHIFSHCAFKEVFYLNGAPDASDAVAASVSADETASRYERLLLEHPADIVLLGIGENGHIAFNDPHVADFKDPKSVKLVSLDTASRLQQVHDGCFSSLEEVPQAALTLTIPALLRPEHVFCTVPAARKKQAVTRALTGPIDESCPSSILRTKKGARLFLDSDSGADLVHIS